MAEAGQVVADVSLSSPRTCIRASPPRELDALAEEHIRSRGGVPTFKGYRGYPASICVSPNSMVVHGIPGEYTLAAGDVVSVDVGVTLGGFVADSAWTFAVGEISPEAEQLLHACRAALEAGIEQARSGNRVGDISAAVQRSAEARRLCRHPQPRRPRRRTLDARGAADPQLRRAGPRARGSSRA